MTRAKFKDFKAGRTLYVATVQSNADGSRSVQPVEALRIAQRPRKEARIPEVPTAVREWLFSIWTQRWFEETPKVSELHCLCYDVPVPGGAIRTDSSLYRVSFLTRKAAEKFGQAFLLGKPTPGELADAAQRERSDAFEVEAQARDKAREEAEF